MKEDGKWKRILIKVFYLLSAVKKNGGIEKS